jgi:hypothetical protein
VDWTGGWVGRKLLLVRPTGESGAAGRPRVLSSGERIPRLAPDGVEFWFWSSTGFHDVDPLLGPTV